MKTFSDRVQTLVDLHCKSNVTEFARRLGHRMNGEPLNDASVQAWLRPNKHTGRPSEPRGARRDEILSAMAQEFNVSIEWLNGVEPDDKGEGLGFVPFLEAITKGMVGEAEGQYHFSTDSTFARNAARYRSVKVQGNSMSPTLREGDYVVIDLEQSQIGEGLYVVDFQNQILTKMIQIVKSNRINLLSENQIFPPVLVDLENDDFKILGKVVAEIKTIK